jgi:hypothetical protein
MVRVTEGTVVSVRQMAMGQDIGMWLTATALATDPRSGLTVIVMTIRSEGVAASAEGDALGIIATGQTDDRVLIDLVMAQREDAQCAQVIIDITQDVIESLAGIASDFADIEVGESSQQIVEAGDGLEVVVAVGGDERAGERPIGREAVVQDVEGFGLVAETMLALGGRGALLGVVL